MNHICIVTSTRADWGLLSPLAANLKGRADIDLSIIATNMHLDSARGMTVSEIECDGFEVTRRVAMAPIGDTPLEAAKAMGLCLSDMAEALADICPDIVVILGDRYEMLAVASAATLLGIPIAHIHGGETTEGAIDDNIRHAISKLAALHFPSTEVYRRRLIAMGEQPGRVINAGALGVYNALNVTLMSRDALQRSFGFEFANPSLIVTYHPVTTQPGMAKTGFASLLRALDSVEAQLIFTYPNNDPEGNVIIGMINDYVAQHPERAHAIPSMGRVRYLSALRQVDAVVGNSSSGIIEVPSTGIPTVDIGSRQRGRVAAESVIHCGDSFEEILAAINQALTPQMRALARSVDNPYAKPDTPDVIASTLASIDPKSLLPKKFYP